MDPVKEQELFDKYPKIFRQKDLSPQETCMCWGIECGDGWYWLLDNLCGYLQRYCDTHGVEQIEAAQVKQKFGGLRFYVDHATDVMYEIIHFAEHLSYSICEQCGTTKDVSSTKGAWISMLCPECKEEMGVK